MILLEFIRQTKTFHTYYRPFSGWAKGYTLVSTYLKKIKIRQIGDPVLREKATLVKKDEINTPEFKKIIEKLVTTMRKHDGIGLAAPQIGYSLQLCVVEFTDDSLKFYHDKCGSELVSKMDMSVLPLKILINPEIEIIDRNTVSFPEGCLSLEGFSAIVPRAKTISVKALNEDGKVIRFVANGYNARIIQHEVDHLKGDLYIDCMQYKSLYNEKWRRYLT